MSGTDSATTMPDWVGALYPDGRDPPPPGVFEIGLVLGGTVSAGAYTAGVLDFLVEALDEWQRAKDDGRADTPGHRVIVKVIAGTSGGAVCAAILARAIATKFPHVGFYAPPEAKAANPFYRTWVDALDIGGLLETDDLDGAQPLMAALNASLLTRATQWVVSYPAVLGGTAPPPIERAWVEPGLSLRLTLGNLRGVPYLTDFGAITTPSGTSAPLTLAQTRHDMVANFLVDTRVKGSSLPAPVPAADEIGLSSLETGPFWAPFDRLGAAARGSSAFPIGLPAQALDVPMSFLTYRVASVVTQAGTIATRPLPVDWAALGPNPKGPAPGAMYDFAVVDGGTTDNEPVELARVKLAGQGGRNPREAHLAQRVVILIDPFMDPPDLGLTGKPASALSLAGILWGLIGLLLSQSRASTADVSLQADPSVFSRFLVTPVRASSSATGGFLVGARAAATTALHGFLGFLSRDFRHHDFLLGRANAQAFLRDEFLMAPTNPGFATGAAFAPAPPAPADATRPVIPLVGSALAPQLLPDWPVPQFDPAPLKDAIAARLRAVISKALQDCAWYWRALGATARGLLANWAAGKVMGAIQQAITDRRD